MSISPYITASIVIQLLTSVFPSLEEMSKEGEAGRRKLSKYTKCYNILEYVLEYVQSKIY